ncbi:hypothetical protein NL676_008369 [Syzygium grande]|nr:hypothetical protein NL676_008369 [Syzygium grande]
MVSWSNPKGAATGVEGTSSEWCLRKGETMSGMRVSKLLEEVVVVVVGFGVDLDIPRVDLSELGVDEAWMIKDPWVNARHVVGRRH